MPKVVKQTPIGKTAKGGVISVIDRIAPMSFDDDEGIKILLYGRSGSGKTTLWGTFPGPILSIIRSGGKKPGELRSLDTPANRKKIQQVVLGESKEVMDLVKYQEEEQKFKTLVLDHSTGLQDLVLAEILGLDPDDMPVQKSWGLATQQQYGQCTAQCKEYLRALLGLSCNVVIIAQEREFNTDNEAAEFLAPTVGAALSPSLTGWLNTAVDYICQTYIRQKTEIVTTKINGKEHQTLKKTKGVDYCLRVGPDAVYTTKFRQPKGYELPEAIIDPDYKKLMEQIKRS